MITKVLMVGCGDIGIRIARQLPQEKYQCTGLRRTTHALPDFITPLQVDLNGSTSLAELLPSDYDYVVITLVPAERTDQGYQFAYVDNLRKIMMGLLAQSKRPKHVFLVSSTSVYGQVEGEWVDELSVVEPTGFSGKRILEGEQLLAESALPNTVVRFSGIYGPGRLRVIKQVQAGDHGCPEEGYSNRIHAEDCAGAITHLIQQVETNVKLDDLYLATDCEPVLLGDVKRWIADTMGITNKNPSQKSATGKSVNELSGMNRGNKRCSNQRLLSTGYSFRYPTFREGYGEILVAEGLLKSP